jgi:hypothetical protein
MNRLGRCGQAVAMTLLLGSSARFALGTAPTLSAPAPAADELADILVEAPEPRYVSPTNRDQIGRIWAPVSSTKRNGPWLLMKTGAQIRPI